MPARLRDIARVLALFGARVEEPNSGSHWKTYAKSGAFYPIPAGNGMRTEIGDMYIRKMCRALGLDEAEFRRLL